MIVIIPRSKPPARFGAILERAGMRGSSP